MTDEGYVVQGIVKAKRPARTLLGELKKLRDAIDRLRK